MVSFRLHEVQWDLIETVLRSTMTRAETAQKADLALDILCRQVTARQCRAVLVAMEKQQRARTPK